MRKDSTRTDGWIEGELLVIWFELERGGELSFGGCRLFFRDSKGAGQLMIFHVRTPRRIDRVKHFPGKIELTEAKRGADECDLISVCVRFQTRNPLPPGNGFAAARELGGFRHDAASRHVVLIQF